MGESIGIGILGGTGYGAGELLRLLTLHPECEVVTVVSSSQAGEPLALTHPHLAGFCMLSFAKQLDFTAFSKYQHKVLFAALPHGTSGQTLTALVPEAQERGFKIIDLSGDLRLSDTGVRTRHYPEAGVSAELQSLFAYGLTEINREKIAQAQFVANPGCFASTCILAAAPLADSGLIRHIFFDGKSGTSGAGKTPSAAFHHPQAHSNVNAYKILEHRHEPEIAQGLGDPRSERLSISFVPHVIPAARGIYVTAQVLLEQEISTEELMGQYRSFYQHSPFIRVRDTVADLHSVIGSNFCDISVRTRGAQAVVVAALDNLVKGMCGVAIQNCNLMCGLKETTGLWYPGLGPI